jgi:hypothetical protein
LTNQELVQRYLLLPFYWQYGIMLRVGIATINDLRSGKKDEDLLWEWFSKAQSRGLVDKVKDEVQKLCLNDRGLWVEKL